MPPSTRSPRTRAACLRRRRRRPRAAEIANATVGCARREQGAEVGNVVKVVASVAEQTKLFSTNATIEVARAGEAGKGFAVVANEVKELAKETARATEDIGQKIEAIQRGRRAGGEGRSWGSGRQSTRSTTCRRPSPSAVEEQERATTNEIARNISRRRPRRTRRSAGASRRWSDGARRDGGRLSPARRGRRRANCRGSRPSWELTRRLLPRRGREAAAAPVAPSQAAGHARNGMLHTSGRGAN